MEAPPQTLQRDGQITSIEHEPLARINVITPVSVIIPTYREVENIPLILERLSHLKDAAGVDLEAIFMDDDSRDGSVEAVAASGCDWARIIVRTGPRGLSAAVVDGFRVAKHPILICMDCDLSHPPEKIPDLVLALASGQQFAIGSRYVPGGKTDDDWGFFRWLNSRVATILARPLTKANDPMSGFFAMRQSDFHRAANLNPIGYKIALELIVKCGLENVAEIPITFVDRIAGESKLSAKEQIKYLQHLRRLYIYKFGTMMELIQFLVVGASGVIVNLLVIALLRIAGAADQAALAGGVGVSLITNFLLNRRFTFSYARDRKIWKQFGGFVGASLVGLIVNYSVALALVKTVFDGVSGAIYFAALIGVIAGMTFNFIGNRYLVFRKHVQKSI